MLNNDDLQRLVTDFENQYVERKPSGDSKGWLRTVVGFANSTPVGFPAVLFIGVRPDGSLEDIAPNLDSLQKSLSERLSTAYPPIYYLPQVVTVGGKKALAVVVPGSERRPHFSDHAYVREGSQTKKASEEQFERLLSQRSSKGYEILKWLNKSVAIDKMRAENIHSMGSVAHSTTGVVLGCTVHFVTVKLHSGDSPTESYPLERVRLSFNNADQRLKLEVSPI